MGVKRQVLGLGWVRSRAVSGWMHSQVQAERLKARVAAKKEDVDAVNRWRKARRGCVRGAVCVVRE